MANTKGKLFAGYKIKLNTSDEVMAVATEGPASSSNQSGELSAEDVAWADSCLVRDPDTSNVDWNSLKDALIDILTAQTEPSDYSAVQNNGFPGGTDTEMLSSREMVGGTDIRLLPSSEQVAAAQSPRRIVDDQYVPFSDLASDKETGILMSQVFQRDSSEPTFLIDDDPRISFNELIDKEDILMSQVFPKEVSRAIIGDDFPPVSTDGQKETEETDTGFDLVSSASEEEPSTSDIFRVWDLNIPAEEEEDEFVKQLNKALEPAPLINDDPGALKDLKVESVDDLIAGIADLSLKH